MAKSTIYDKALAGGFLAIAEIADKMADIYLFRTNERELSDKLRRISIDCRDAADAYNHSAHEVTKVKKEAS